MAKLGFAKQGVPTPRPKKATHLPTSPPPPKKKRHPSALRSFFGVIATQPGHPFQFFGGSPPKSTILFLGVPPKQHPSPIIWFLCRPPNHRGVSEGLTLEPTSPQAAAAEAIRQAQLEKARWASVESFGGVRRRWVMHTWDNPQHGGKRTGKWTHGLHPVAPCCLKFGPYPFERLFFVFFAGVVVVGVHMAQKKEEANAQLLEFFFFFRFACWFLDGIDFTTGHILFWLDIDGLRWFGWVLFHGPLFFPNSLPMFGTYIWHCFGMCIARQQMACPSKLLLLCGLVFIFQIKRV